MSFIPQNIGIKFTEQNFISMTAINIDADENIRSLSPALRNCLFENENQYFTIHRKYSQYNCFMECALNLTRRKMFPNSNLNFVACVPWYFPFSQKRYRICNPLESNEFLKKFQNTNYDLECQKCLPDCKHTIYKHKISVEPIQSCDEKTFGISPLCDYRDKSLSFLAKNWGKQVLDELDQVIEYSYFFEDEMLSDNASSYLYNITSSQRSDETYGANIFT